MWNVDWSEFTVTQCAGEFSSIDAIGLECSFFMDGGDICWVDDDTINTERLELIVDPEAAVTSFVGTVIVGSREVALKVDNEHLWLGRLCEGFVFDMLCQDADLPGVFADVDSDEQLLTGEVKFCMLGSHDEPRFVCGFGTDIPNLQNKVESYDF